MNEFIRAVFSGDLPFLRYALLASMASSVSFGVVGTLVVVRRLTSLAGAIAHAALGGVGAALYCQRVVGWEWCLPLYGAAAGAVLAAFIVGAVSLHAKEREDTVIGAVWALGMATGLLFMARLPGYVDLQGYLFGNILVLSAAEVWTILALDALVLLLLGLCYNSIVAVAFDAEFARLRGLKVKAIYYLMLIMTALTVVLMVNVAGIILVIALLTLPAAAAGCFARSLGPMMLMAGIFSFLCSGGALAASFVWDLPSGPLAVIAATLVYGAVLTLRRIFRRSVIHQ